MTDETPAGAGWFDGLDPGDVDAAAAAVRTGSADEPRAWPALAIERGFADTESAYYDHLHHASATATESAVREREQAADRQLVHAVRAMDDCTRTANELAERVAEWGGTVDADAGTGIEYARRLADREPKAGEEALHSLATRVTGLADEADNLREFVEREAPAVAPNLAALAGPVLAARLVSLVGSLEALAKKPSGTVQVLGAEDALFAHLRGHAPSPKHGIIYTHDAVRGTPHENRGSAARALAGKLSIAARIDHYSGDERPELAEELADRIETIQARTDGRDGTADGADGTADGDDGTAGDEEGSTDANEAPAGSGGETDD